MLAVVGSLTILFRSVARYILAVGFLLPMQTAPACPLCSRHTVSVEAENPRGEESEGDGEPEPPALCPPEGTQE